MSQQFTPTQTGEWFTEYRCNKCREIFTVDAEDDIGDLSKFHACPNTTEEE